MVGASAAAACQLPQTQNATPHELTRALTLSLAAQRNKNNLKWAAQPNLTQPFDWYDDAFDWYDDAFDWYHDA
jgi:hypothetical protein